VVGCMGWGYHVVRGMGPRALVGVRICGLAGSRTSGCGKVWSLSFC